MKKIFLLSLTFLLVLCIMPLNAQLLLGPKAGLNIANITGDDVQGMNLETKTGFNGGIFLSYQFEKLFAVQPEIIYTMKGATTTQSGVDVTLSFDYVEIPVLLKLIIPVEGSSVKPSIFAGPSLGFNTTAKVKGESGSATAEVDIKDETKSTEFSLVFGGGIGFMVDNNELGFDVRYVLGLTTTDDSPGTSADIKNTVISINAYWGFALN